LGFEIPRFIPRGFGVAVVILLATYIFAHQRAASLSTTLTSSKQTLSTLQKIAQEAKLIEDQLPALRERAKVFQSRMENRKVWSKLFEEIVLCCPEEIQLTEIKLTVPRTGAQQSKELAISGFYVTTGNVENSEMMFKEELQRNKIIGAHYKSFIAMTKPMVGKTDFWIRCTE
jgi:Tfp pilus assembly protein PilN